MKISRVFKKLKTRKLRNRFWNVEKFIIKIKLTWSTEEIVERWDKCAATAGGTLSDDAVPIGVPRVGAEWSAVVEELCWTGPPTGRKKKFVTQK